MLSEKLIRKVLFVWQETKEDERFKQKMIVPETDLSAANYMAELPSICHQKSGKERQSVCIAYFLDRED